MLFGKRTRIVKRILVVEDEPLVAFDNETMIADAGYEVVATVDRYADAVAQLDESEVDLILSDILLTGERSGVDLAREAKRRGVPVLFVTAHPPAGAEELAIGHLLKPYNERALKAALKAIDRHLAGKLADPPEGLVFYSA
ncbi:response regulator [Sphingomonas sp. GCM10030256]|uniref:response regulator n=1 Tax=Sphingomonas sp. GCM10030256 TaxID=3273427 RepID=UPI0036144EC5